MQKRSAKRQTNQRKVVEANEVVNWQLRGYACGLQRLRKKSFCKQINQKKDLDVNF